MAKKPVISKHGSRATKPKAGAAEARVGAPMTKGQGLKARAEALPSEAEVTKLRARLAQAEKTRRAMRKAQAGLEAQAQAQTERLVEAAMELEAEVRRRQQAEEVLASQVQELEIIQEELRVQNEALRESEDQYRSLFDASPDAILLIVPDGQILAANAAARRMFGYTEDDFRRLGHDGLVRPWDRSLKLAQSQRALTGHWAGELTHVRKNGETFPSEVSSVVFKDKDGRARANTVIRDITERKRRETELNRLNRTLEALSSINQAMMRSTNEAAYMEDVCRIVVEVAGHAMVWIGLAEHDEGKTVRPVAHAGFEEGYLETLKLTWADTERGRGPTGTAIRTGRVSMCRNMLTDPKFAPWRGEAQKRGYASSIVLPLMSEGKAFGALTIYSRDPDPFTPGEVDLLSELAGDLAYGILAIRLRAAHARAEEALRESEVRRQVVEAVEMERRRLFAVLETVPVMICLLTRDYRIAFANRSFREKFGESNGRRCHEYCFGQPEPCDFCESYTPLKTGQPHRYELTGPDGSVIEAHDFPFTDVDGSQMILEMDLDITARRRAEEVLRQASRYNRSLLEASPDPLVTITPEGKIGDVNTATEVATGYSRADLIGADFSEFFTEPDKARASYQRVFTEGLVRDYALELRHRDGHTTSVLYNASVYKDEGGQVAGVFADARDMTERKRAEDMIHRLNRDLESALAEERSMHEQLVQAEKLGALGRMVGSVAHELNNPLQTITNCFFLANQDLAPDSPIHAYLEMAQAETERLVNLVAQLRELYRMRPTGAPEPRRVDQLLQEVRSLLTPQLEHAHVQWQQPSELPEYAVPVIQDRLKQVLINLATNAIEAMQPQGGGKLTIAVKPSADGRQVGVSIRDTGPGIPPEHLSRVFEPFFTTKDHGLGLGLSICYEIMQQHGGQITAESHRGQGAVFTVWLPRVPA